MRRLEPAQTRLDLRRREPPALGATRELGPDPLKAALEGLGDRVVEQRARPAETGQLGDSGAHRAGAGHADRARCARHRGQEGMSALMPVNARPMISFWICEVPS